jgi:aminoglycoside phosphotransferase
VSREAPGGPILARALAGLMGPDAFHRPPSGEVSLEPLPSSRAVYRFSFPEGKYPVVGKFFAAFPPRSSLDQGLAQEYDNYLLAPSLGLGEDAVPRLIGRRPEAGLGLLLEAVPGPDLDGLLVRAVAGDAGPLQRGLARLAELLALFHSRPLPEAPVPPYPALAYLDKLQRQLGEMGLLHPEERRGLAEEGRTWEGRLAEFPDHLVLVHGDATPTNFLFPDGRAVALDLERLRLADRLWDLSWVAGELKHAWGWRAGNFPAAEGAIHHFFRAYLEAVLAEPALARRLYHLNPFYMALAELRIARNAYLAWDYRRELVAEARRCLAWGRRL